MQVKLNGIDKLIKGLAQFPKEIALGMGRAGVKAGTKYIIEQDGAGNYPGTTAANAPPAPYYVRGTGMVGANGRVLKGSETLGKQFYAKPGASGAGGFQTLVGNRASYAKYVVGDYQPPAMRAIGWRKLIDIGRENIAEIRVVYQEAVTDLIKKLGL